MRTEVANARVSSPKAVPAISVLACAWPALLLATFCLLPHLNKAFLIDDPWFLTMARQIVKHPTHPTNFDICWNLSEGPPCTKAYYLGPENVLMGYLLVPTVLVGAHEWTAHLTQLVFVWIAVVAMTSLIFRFGWDRWHATAGALLLVAIPPFLPMASTAMPDILATTVALVAMESLAAWKAEQKWGQAAGAALALGCAGVARSHLALLLPLAAFFLLDSIDPREILGQFRRRFWLWTPVFAGCGVLLIIILVVREHNLAITPPPTAHHVRSNLYAYLAYFAFPLPLSACWLANRLKAGRLRIVLIVFALGVAVLCGVAVASLLLHRNTSSSLFFLRVIGCFVLTDLLFEATKRRERTGLFLMFWLLIPLPIVYYVHLPMKYLLPCIPAVILLCFRLLEGASVQFFRVAAILLIVASTGYSLLILHSDEEFADFGREAMYRLIGPHAAAGQRVWFGGQYWSYWYAPLAGATLTFQGGPQPKPGDLLVVDVYAALGQSPLKRFPHRTLVEVIFHKYRFGRTMGAGKGLYSNVLGYWLWGFGESEKDRFELWRID